jgi:hypothetical protein
MMVKKILVFLFLLLLIHAGSAQVPGYMGKRLIIGYSLNFSGAFFSPTANSSKGFSDFNGINTTHVLNLDYIYHRRKAVCLLVQYARTGVDYFYFNNIYYDGDQNKPAILNSLGVGLGIKLFRRANFAPYGPYVKWEFVAAFNNVVYDNKNYSKADPNNSSVRTKTTAGSGKVDFESLGIGYSFGKQRIYRDKFVFDRGIRFLVFPAGYADIIGSEGYFRSADSGFESEGSVRIFRHQLISFHLGIGFLAF